MGRKRKIGNLSPVKEPPKPVFKDDGKPSFDIPAVLLIADIVYFVRKAIVEEAPRYHKGLGPIPKAAVMTAIKKLNLEQFLKDKEEKNDA